MKRINVIGTTGSGKSTVSKQLADQLGYPYFQMDQLFWKSNWIESTDEVFFPKVQKAVSGETWVLDGNFGRTKHIKWERVDTIVWVDYSYGRTLWQLLTRTVSRAVSKQELWEGTGNKESFRKSFLNKKSIIIWFLKNYQKNKLRYARLMNEQSMESVEFIRLRNPKETKAFLESITV